MVVVWIPALLRDLTGGMERVTLEAGTVAEVIDALTAAFRGCRAAVRRRPAAPGTERGMW